MKEVKKEELQKDGTKQKWNIFHTQHAHWQITALQGKYGND